MIGLGAYNKRVTFQDPSAPVPDGRGGYTQTWHDITPALGWKVSIKPATVADLERISGGGSVITTGTVTVRGRRHPGVSTKTRMIYSGKTFSITGAIDEDFGGHTMALAAVEQVTP